MNSEKNNLLLCIYPQLEKIVKYLLEKQNSDGSYPSLNPDPTQSMYFLGVLNEFEIKPNENTVKWVQSLQTGKRGFGETTGENSWDYTTYFGSQMHNFIRIKPRFYKEFESFIKMHQNKDGGFGPVLGADSNIISTVEWSLSLLDLGFQINDKEGLYNYLSNSLTKMHELNLKTLFMILRIFKKIEKPVDEKIKNLIIFKLKDIYRKVPKFTIDIEKFFYYFSILNLIGIEPKDVNIDFILKSQNSDGGFGNCPYSNSDSQSTYFALRLISMVKHSLLNQIKEKIIEYAKKNENKYGGFSNLNNRTTHSAYACVSALKLLGYEPIKKDLLLVWLKYCQNSNGGFASYPNSMANEKTTYWTVEIFRILKSLHIIDRELLIKFILNHLETINPYSSYYITGTCEVLDIIPNNYNNITDKILQYQTYDGGFSSIIDGEAEMYETFRAINTLYFLGKILERRNMSYNIKSRIKENVIKWVLSCENENGGFSWIPNDVPYIQPTYHALTVLNILNEEIRNSERHIKWILKFQNSDGGFNGGEIGTPSDIHFIFWALESIRILKNCER